VSPREIRVRARSDDYQLIDALKRNRKKRAQCGLFIVEGVRPINLMCEYDWVVDSYVFSAERRQSDWAEGTLSRSTAKRHYLLSDELMAEISDKQETSELMAIVETQARGSALGSFVLGDPALVVVADRPASPGNLGTLIRSCDALGADGLAVFGHAADIFDPRTVRASTGSLFRLPVVSVESPRTLESWLGELRKDQPALQVVGSSATGPTSLATLNWTQPTILMVGSERSGLGRSLTEMCDAIVSIPISGAASSLNVASAASILLYEVARQRVGLTGPERS
jgi:tRNA G18 (ribose-2'-O)-methylase SpoU